MILCLAGRSLIKECGMVCAKAKACVRGLTAPSTMVTGMMECARAKERRHIQMEKSMLVNGSTTKSMARVS